ncbi:MAG: T9SS type A sorting domain-containing protein [Bacteroidia bacterium]
MPASNHIIPTLLFTFVFGVSGLFAQNNLASRDDSINYSDVSTTSGEVTSIYPKFVLHPNFPNPVTGYMTIRYDIKEPGRYVVCIVGIKGQEIKRLVDKTHQKGEYKIHWAASPKAHGVYMYKIDNGIPTNHRQLLLLKY